MKALLTGLGLISAFAIGLQAQSAPGVDIGVRSGIDPAEKAKRDHDPAYAQEQTKHGQVYVLASIKEETLGTKLIKPVNASAMAAELKRQLQKRGFRAAEPDQTPDIVITVKYARGVVPNPFINPDFLGPADPRKIDRQRVGLSDDDPVNYFQVHETFVGLEHKAAKIGAEKLAIQVRAWKYPPPADPKQKAKLAWMTTMYADDPDHRDLNLIMPQMLAVGAPHFNQHLERERPVEMNTAYPDGHVNVGTPEVVKSSEPAGK